MESVLEDDSPLAQALLEGDGQAESLMFLDPPFTSRDKEVDNDVANDVTSDAANDADDYADNHADHHADDNADMQYFPYETPASFISPRPKSFHTKLQQRLGHPLKISIPDKGPVAIIQDVCSDAVSSNIQVKDNEQFLDSFRYIIVRSHLLREQAGTRDRHRTNNPLVDNIENLKTKRESSWTTNGVYLTFSFVLFLSLMIRWIIRTTVFWFGLLKSLFLGMILFVFWEMMFASTRRQRLQKIRDNSIKLVEEVLANFEAFDNTSSAAIILIQEVEAVSRGYHLNGGVPPVSILEAKTPDVMNRRCKRIRRVLCATYSTLIPNIINACKNLQDYVQIDDYERQLEVHEVPEPDIQEALSGATISEIEDQESLRALRAMHLRFAVLRRVFLCRLLSLPADGTQKDISPWKTCIQNMNDLTRSTGLATETINQLLMADDFQSTNAQSTFSPVNSNTSRSSPERERYKKQLRKVAELSNDLKLMQTKLFILRDDVSRILESAASTTSTPTLSSRSSFTGSTMSPPNHSGAASQVIQASFNNTADAIATEIKAFTVSFESWRSSLSHSNSHSHPPDTRRTSWNSIYSGSTPLLRSPSTTFSGFHLSSVDEFGPGSNPTDALKILNGEISRDSGSPACGSGSDEEVFEAIGMPRLRGSRPVFGMKNGLVDASMADELRERRERQIQGGAVVRELESVIEERSRLGFSSGRIKRMSTGRLAGLGPVDAKRIISL